MSFINKLGVGISLLSLSFSIFSVIVSQFSDKSMIEQFDYSLAYDHNGCDQFNKDRNGNYCVIDDDEMFLGSIGSVKYIKNVKTGDVYIVDTKK